MSSNLKLSEKQLPKYYNMLPPICEKLGIDVPDLYLTHDVNPNAYTSGDTKPFILITSGLIETVPDELIPTVLAHECGHIACHHVLYHTMGRMLLNGTLMGLNFFGINEIAIVPLKLAFFHWMRCSEFSADRAAAICDGTSDNIV
jgi:Zn-dependent protease with chaperone function